MPTVTPTRLGGAVGVLACAALFGCGGGGGGGGSPPPPPSFTVGGNVSGLSGTLVLQNNGGGDLTVTADGAFTFATSVASGGAYAVSVRTQPTGQTCAVTAGTGQVAANVTQVAVGCTFNQYRIGGTVRGLVRPIVLQNNGGDRITINANGAFTFPTTLRHGTAYSVSVAQGAMLQVCPIGAGSGTATGDVTAISVDCAPNTAAFLMPLNVTPSGGAGTGTTGFYVVPTDLLGAAPIRIASSSVQGLAYALPYSRDARGRLTAGNPTQFIYVSYNASGGDHVYALDLTASSTFVPRQLTNLTLPLPRVSQRCSNLAAWKNLNDPSSLLILYKTTSPTGVECAGPYAIIRLTDSASTTPTYVSLPDTAIFAFYAPNGSLAGFALVDTDRRLKFYADETFTSPTILMTGVVSIGNLQAATPSVFSSVRTRPESLMIRAVDLGLVTTVRSIDYTGRLSPSLHRPEGQILQSDSDDTFLYFIDGLLDPASGATSRLLRVRLDGTTAAQQIFSEDMSARGSPPLELVGIGASRIFVQHGNIIDPVTQARSGDLLSLPLDGIGTPTRIATFDRTTSTTLVGDHLLVSGTVSNFPTSQVFSTGILGLDGAVVQPQLEGSTFASRNPIVQFDAGAFYFVDPRGAAGPVRNRLRRSDGAAFSLPASPWPFPGLVAVSPTVGFGTYTVGVNSIGIAADLADSRIESYQFPISSVRFLLQSSF